MLCSHLRAGKVQIMFYHLQGGMSQYLLQREYVSTIHKVVYSERITAKMSMDTLYP